MSFRAAEFDTVAPATGERLGTIRETTANDVEGLVSAARAAQWAWWRRGSVQRAELLVAAARILHRDAEELAALAAREVGKPVAESRAEVARAAQIFAYYGGIGRETGGGIHASAEAGVSIATRAVPLGVAGVISPWNFPVAIPAWKIAPALAAGCTVVWKPAPEAALTAERLAAALHAAGVAPDVLTVAQGGGEVGAALVASDIDALSFTGSTAVGRRLGEQLGAGGHPRVTLELGGVNVSHVLADADLEAASTNIAAAAFGYAGQKCTATQVVAVDEANLTPFVAALEKAAARLPVGDPLDPSTVVGPVISAMTAQGLREQADAALDASRHAWRGTVPDGESYVAPAFAVLDDGDAALLREEVFGPVAAVVPVDSIEARVRLVAATGLGLAGAIYGRDEQDIRRLANRLPVGVLAVNRPSTGLDPHVPFGGWAGSGGAFAEQGREGLRFYLKWQSQYWKSTDVDSTLL